MNIANVKLGVTCFFTVEKINSDGDVIYSTGPFKNTMLNSGLLKLYSYSLINMMSYINIGSGSSSPAATQTGLDSINFSTNVLFNSQYYFTSSIDDLWRGYKKVFQFGIGTCTGTFSELGLSRSNNAEYLNRQLFKVPNGATTTITVAATEGLRITAEVRIYFDTSNIRMYSEVYKISLFNAVGRESYTDVLTIGSSAGNINMYNGTIFSIYYIVDEINKKYGKNVISCFTGDVINSYGYLYGNIRNEESLGLNILSFDLAGYTQIPEITIHKEFDASKLLIESILPYNNEVDGTNTGLTLKTRYHLCVKYASGSFVSGYGDYGSTASELLPSTSYIDKSFYHIRLLAINPDNTTTCISRNSSTTISQPSVDNLSITYKDVYAPGRLGSGNKRLYGFVLNNESPDSTSYNGTMTFVFDEEVIITDIEEFEFEYTISWSGL